MIDELSRREFARSLGISAIAAPMIMGLPDVAQSAGVKGARQRLIFFFTPNGTLPPKFWPDETGEAFKMKEIMKPLEGFRDRLLCLKGLDNKIRGDGDGHMRGMSCLLTGIELFPGNVQGGSHTPAGWAKGPSIDQELKRVLQASPETRTRFGSLEFGVGVTDRADPWTRMSYAGPNQPVAPIDDPYQMFRKLYGNVGERKVLGSVMDGLEDDLEKVSSQLSGRDRALLERHAGFVRQMESELRESGRDKGPAVPPVLNQGVANTNDHIPELCRMQMDLLVNALQHDMARVGTFQFSKSVGQSKMRWLGIDEGHHKLSHEPDSNSEAQDKLLKVNVWLADQLAYLLSRLAATPEADGEGSLLDHTTVVWTNELGKGNSHTRNDVPFALFGGGLGFRSGRSLHLDRQPHNRLLLSFAHAFGHKVETFGNPRMCEAGPLDLS